MITNIKTVGSILSVHRIKVIKSLVFITSIIGRPVSVFTRSEQRVGERPRDLFPSTRRFSGRQQLAEVHGRRNYVVGRMLVYLPTTAIKKDQLQSALKKKKKLLAINQLSD